MLLGITVYSSNWQLSQTATTARIRFCLTNCTVVMFADGYYSSAATKYLIYENPVRSSWSASWSASPTSDGSKDQLDALKSALAIGRVLDRVVILPRFHCKNGDDFDDCPLNSLIAIAPFDSKYDALYRESSFLLNAKVPSAVRRSVSTLRSVVSNSTSGSSGAKFKTAELIERLKSVDESVLALTPLYDVFVEFLANTRDRWIQDVSANKTFHRCDYHQSCMLTWLAERLNNINCIVICTWLKHACTGIKLGGK